MKACIILALMATACQPNQASPRDRIMEKEKLTEEIVREIETKEPNRPAPEIGWLHDLDGGLAVVIDHGTGCQYVAFSNGYKGGAALTPRMSRAGFQICDAKEPAK